MFNLLPNFHEESKDKEKKKGQRLFHAKDFQSLMSPCFTFCRILGIFPYKINASTFKISKPRYFLLIVIICISDICALAALYDSTNFRKIDMTLLPKILLYDCLFGFGGIFIMTVTLILCGPRMRLLQMILKISSRLSTESYQKLSKFIHAKDIIGSFYLIWFIFLGFFALEINFGFQIYINLVVFQMDMLYMNCVCILKACFKRINDNLTHMCELMASHNSYGSRLIYHEQRHPFLLMELKALKKEHLMISDTVQMLNLIFSLQLIATVVLIFFDVTIKVYYYILYWSFINSLLTNTFRGVLCLILLLTLTAFNFIKIVFIVWACETGKNQALQISTSVHDIFNSVTDVQLKDELQLFSLQILHCNNTFNAKGFTMDAKFLTRIVGSIATYALILLQFKRMSSSFCEKKTANNITELIL